MDVAVNQSWRHIGPVTVFVGYRVQICEDNRGLTGVEWQNSA